MASATPDRSRILVVDDDIRTTRLFVRMLREDGFDVDVAYDGASAIDRLRSAIMPDALVTDVLMPRADGFVVAKYARSLSPRLPIFMVTGYPERVDAKLLDPVPRVFTKPLDYASLANELSRVLRGTF